MLSSGFGRTEIRCCSGSGQFIWVDFAVNSFSFKEAFAIVMATLKPASIALHPGKYDSSTLQASFSEAVADLEKSRTVWSYTPPHELATPHQVFSGENSTPLYDIGTALFGGLDVGTPPDMLRH